MNDSNTFPVRHQQPQPTAALRLMPGTFQPLVCPLRCPECLMEPIFIALRAVLW